MVPVRRGGRPHARMGEKDPSVVPVSADADGGVMDHAREMFRKYDVDGGGEIDASEFTALCYGSTPRSLAVQSQLLR